MASHGFPIYRADLEHILGGDVTTHRAILCTAFPWLRKAAWEGRAGPIRSGQPTTRFGLAIAATVPGAMLVPSMWNDKDFVGITRTDKTKHAVIEVLAQEFGFGIHALHCPGIGVIKGGNDPSIMVLGTAAAVAAAQQLINEDFARAMVPAERLAGIVAYSASDNGKGEAWADMAAAVKHANEGTKDEGTLAWNEGRHIAIVIDHVDYLLAQLRALLGPRGVDFTAGHPAVLAFVQSVKATMANGLPFYDGSKFNKGTPAHFPALVAAWQSMWTILLGEQGVNLPWNRDDAVIQRTLAGHLAHAAIHAWVVGKAGSQVNIIEHYVKERYAASIKIAVHAGSLGMTITHRHDLPIASWSYARIAFKGLDDPNQPPMEYVIRFHPDQDPFDPLGAGFQVLAACTNPNEKHVAERDYAPAQVDKVHPSPTPVADVWNAILAGQPPPGYGTDLPRFLDGLDRVQVGGMRLKDEPDPNHPGQFMQNTRWVAMLRDIAPRR